MTVMANWTEAVEAELNKVIDPCSCLTMTPLSIVDLGLVRQVAINDDAILVKLSMTDPMCMYFVDIGSEIRRRIAGLGWTGPINVHWDTAVDWDPSLMTPAAREARERARERLRLRKQSSPATGR